jgi:hypothetical protein
MLRRFSGENGWLLRLLVSGHPSQESYVLLQRSTGSATVDEWTHAPTLDQTGVGKDFKMMRNSRWRDSLKACNITARHLFPGGDTIKN